MSVSAVSSSVNTPNVQSPAVAASNQRTADGDYKAKGVGRATVKDSDGDYKPTSTAQTAQTTSSSSVQAALTSLKTGG